MNKTDTSHPPLNKGFGAFKKAIAKFLGVKRLEAGCDFHESAAAMDRFVGDRKYSMGDLWREPLNKQPLAEDEPP